MLKISRETQQKSERDAAPEKEGFMSRFKRDMGMMLTGLALGALLTGGAVAAGITAEPAWSPIYVDGRQVQMTAFNIAGNNYVKLRDIGQAVGFNVYYQNGVQVDSTAPYTGEAPAAAAVQTAGISQKETVRVSCYKEGPLTAGDGTGLMIHPGETEYTVSSSDSSIVSVEKVLGRFWKANAISPGTANVTAVGPGGEAGSVLITVTGSLQNEAPSVDLTANMEIRQELIRLINETRKANGVTELPVSEALMEAAQAISEQKYTWHHTKEECETVIVCGYPHGFGANLTVFTGVAAEDAAQHAHDNWLNSPGHFETMVKPDCDSIGVGVTESGGVTYCYMFTGRPNTHNPYE